jgi:hypothetical protein
MTKFQKIINKLKTMDNGTRFKADIFSDIASPSYIRGCLSRLVGYVKIARSKGKPASYMLTNNDIPDRRKVGSWLSGRGALDVEDKKHRLTVLVDYEVKQKVKGIEPGSRSGVVNEILKKEL